MARLVKQVGAGIGAGIALAALWIAAASAQQLDPKVVAFKLPDQIAWKDNPKGAIAPLSCREPRQSPAPTPCSCNGCPAT